MPPTISGDLKNVGPSAEELAAAKKILSAANEKEKRAKMASMSAFLSKNPDPNISESRGEARQRWLLQFLILQMRAKGGQKKHSSRQEGINEKKKVRDHFWWSREKMVMMLGQNKVMFLVSFVILFVFLFKH